MVSLSVEIGRVSLRLQPVNLTLSFLTPWAQRKIGPRIFLLNPVFGLGNKPRARFSFGIGSRPWKV